jgi:hypothetical protein
MNIIKTKNNKLPPNINTDKAINPLYKNLLMIISIQVRVNELIIKIYNGFLNTPLSPAINPI